MGRKDLLKGLMDEAAPPAPKKTGAASPAQRPATGAIGAVSASVADLKARAVTEIDTALIDPGGLKDRLDDAGQDALTASIAEYGQQVPVLLRPHPVHEGRYQVVYGRRRVAALRRLGKPVKAMVRSLTDRMLILAQGQENTARKDLTFIEKANFARQMHDAGYERKTICDALHLDKTVISRMLQVVDAIPVETIEAIGAAPSVGRDRWLLLAGLMKGRNLHIDAKGESSDQRFEAVLRAAQGPKTKRAPARKDPQRTIQSRDGKTLAQMNRKKTHAELRIEQPEFADYVARQLPQLFTRWKQAGNR